MLEAFLAERGLEVPNGLTEVYSSPEARSLLKLLYWPFGAEGSQSPLEWALNLLKDSVTPPPSNYLPILPVDEMSLACVRCAPKGSDAVDPDVVRWHLGDIDERYQGALLDTSVANYVRSVAEELRERGPSLKRITRGSREYMAEYVARGVRPRGTVPRPVQLACQNVIVGMAVLRHDSLFDGLRVSSFVTCEVPHLATNEANRAMAALILCDAFQNGGTMEIRFGSRGYEENVPPALQRFGRTIGLALGSEDPACISPREARDLFIAVTPMPDELRLRSFDLVDRGVVTPERLCYTLMSNVLTPIELDYVLATSTRVSSILMGGSPAEHRRHRLAEIESFRAAVMLGMLQRRLGNADGAARSSHEVRVFEDGALKVRWSVIGDLGAVALDGISLEDIPWGRSGQMDDRPRAYESLIVVPRGLPTPEDHKVIVELQAKYEEASVVLLVPADMHETVPTSVPTIVCPERTAQIDSEIEQKSARLRVGRL